MGKIQTFFRTLFLSFTSPNYYADIVRAPLSFSFKYYFGYTFLLSLLIAGIITIRWIVPFSDFANKLPTLLSDAYPEELIVTINKGQVSTNVDEPYFIPISAFDPIKEEFEQKVLGEDESDLTNFLVIDTQANVKDIEAYSTFMLITWDSISYINDNGNIETASLEEIENITIDKNSFTKLVNQIDSIIPFIVPIALAGVVFGLIVYGVIRLIYIFILAFVAWIFAKIIRAPLGYWRAYQMGLHFNFIPYTIIMVFGLFELSVGFTFVESLVQILLAITLVLFIKPKLVSKKSSDTTSPKTT